MQVAGGIRRNGETTLEDVQLCRSCAGFGCVRGGLPAFLIDAEIRLLAIRSDGASIVANEELACWDRRPASGVLLAIGLNGLRRRLQLAWKLAIEPECQLAYGFGKVDCVCAYVVEESARTARSTAAIAYVL